MATTEYDFRVLIETESGSLRAYVSSSFADSSTTGISASNALPSSYPIGVVQRINAMYSCSYADITNWGVNVSGEANETGSSTLGSFSNSDNIWVSCSFDGDAGSGSVVFNHTDGEGSPAFNNATHGTNDSADRLKRYKFYGTKICNVLGIPAGQWIYPVNFKLDDTGTDINYFSGDINANNLSIARDLSISPIGRVTSNLRFDVGRKDSDLFVQFTSGSGAAQANLLLFGYDSEYDYLRLDCPADDAYKTVESEMHFRTGSFAKLYVGNSNFDPPARSMYDRNDLSYETLILHGGLNFSYSGGTEVFLPVNGSVVETTSDTYGWANRFIAPYEGYIFSIKCMGMSYTPSTPSGFSYAAFYRYETGNGTMFTLGSPTYATTANTTPMIEGWTANWSFSTNAHSYPGDILYFAKNDTLAFSITPADDIGSAWFTITLKIRTRV
jgi:hypothetical protein